MVTWEEIWNGPCFVCGADREDWGELRFGSMDYTRHPGDLLLAHLYFIHGLWPDCEAAPCCDYIGDAWDRDCKHLMQCHKPEEFKKLIVLLAMGDKRYGRCYLG